MLRRGEGEFGNIKKEEGGLDNLSIEEVYKIRSEEMGIFVDCIENSEGGDMLRMEGGDL